MATINQRFVILILLLLVFAACVSVHERKAENKNPEMTLAKKKAFFEQQDIFLQGKEGYHTFRIPAAAVSPDGTVLAFCEGRKNSQKDDGDIDLVLKRSLDNGRTWEPMQVIWDGGEDTVGNPCPVVDQQTGIIWLPFCLNNDRVYITKSLDNGITWLPPIEITKEVKSPSWGWYATGPGAGIQMQNGRLIIPCDHEIASTKAMESHVIYSVDHGQSWKLGGMITPKVNECQVVERSNHSLMINMRNYSGNQCRAIASSDDFGLNWSPVSYDAALMEPVCQASLIRYDAKGKRPLFLFSNPASQKRENLTIRVSYDEGQTWPVAKTIYAGSSAYSCLVPLPDGSIGCFYERDQYSKLTFARFSIQWLSDGK